jgi:hypothetical protein
VKAVDRKVTNKISGQRTLGEEEERERERKTDIERLID